ncbi:hypothetical protein VFPPC_04045 [Pochonia chlamydosporia 170]|uniref:Rhodopsin domain-containing protein n=1 Tax=Pochonia chlamydosporia 170 TaxID=1380566 RepID=A0A179FR53_METCM|nr:hypothetical protein VFPPC_04045 [Pochonia chlamydosporia 170]OAQ67690.2 hypothetical protein VFPPC_04045 [Pochonia chlamydosporia 170]
MSSQLISYTSVVVSGPNDSNNPDGNRVAELRSTTTILLVLAPVFVVLRFWARSSTNTRYGRDDWMMVVALAFVFVLGALNYSAIAHGLGKHIHTLPLHDAIAFFKILFAFECIYITAVMAIKLSILEMYTRIFGLSSRMFNISAIIIASTIVTWWTSILAVCIFQCNPIKKAWLPWIEGTCINLKGSFIGNAIPNILTDVVMLCMPVRQVWKMHIALLQKLSLCFMFLLGGFVLFASVYRFTTLMQFDTRDTTWTLATACTWCIVEVSCGVISGCLPTLRPLTVKVSHKFGRLASIEAGQSDGNPQHSGPAEVVTIGSAEDKALRKERRREIMGTTDTTPGSQDELPLIL